MPEWVYLDWLRDQGWEASEEDFEISLHSDYFVLYGGNIALGDGGTDYIDKTLFDSKTYENVHEEVFEVWTHIQENLVSNYSILRLDFYYGA